MSYRDILKPQLRIDEGDRQFPYTDTVGKVTIGVGHNLTDNGLSQAAREFILDEDVDVAEGTARSLVANFDALSDARKAVIVNMSFNLGAARLGNFHQTLQAIREARWDDAAAAMLASHWATQVGARAQRLAAAMKEG